MQGMLERYAERRHARLAGRANLDGDRWPAELRRAISRAQHGDSEAIDYIYLRFAGNVYGYARSLVADPHEAEDVTQQVFAKLLTALPAYRASGVPFSAWLLRITRNVAIDELRKRRALPSNQVAPAAAADRERSAELSTALSDALRDLAEDQRNVVVLRHFAGYSPGEIASCLDRSPGAIHALGHRGRRALRRALEQRGIAPVAAAA